MCSITGCIKRSEKLIDFSFLKKIIINGENRGKDSFGIAYLSSKKQIFQKYINKPSIVLKNKNLEKLGFNIILNNNRAEPTTEYIEKKSKNTIQPFFYKNVCIAHNGTISNDNDLEKKFKIKKLSKVDSSIIPVLLNKLWDGFSIEKLKKILIDELIGSYALSIWDKRNPDCLWLAVNYKPLYLLSDKSKNIYFTSIKSYFEQENINDYLNSSYKIIEIKPYTLLKISQNNIQEYSIYREKEEKVKKALIIASSGLDSTVAAMWAKKQNYDISLIHFKYGCRAENAENRSIKNITKFFGCDLIEIPIDFFKNIIKHSRLTNPETSGELMKDGNGIKSAELAWEWVPARNLIFMSIAVAYAEANNYDYIVLGGNLEESGAYPDNELIFQQKFNDILPNSLNLQKRVEVLTPVANLMKHDIVKLGIELDAPLHLTWSCYEDGEIPCGKCGPDFMRRMAFKMNGFIDVQRYKKEDKKFWIGCKEWKKFS